MAMALITNLHYVGVYPIAWVIIEYFKGRIVISAIIIVAGTVLYYLIESPKIIKKHI